MAITQNQKVLTLDYWKPASKLAVGDYVFDRLGNPVKIKLIHPYFAQDCYEVTLDDHLCINGDKNLTFHLEDKKYRKRLDEYQGYFKFRRPLKPLDVSTLLESPLKDKRGRQSFSIPTAQPIKLPTQPNLPVPPFVFGFWFANRTKIGRFHTVAGRHDAVAARLKDYGYQITLGSMMANGQRNFTISPSIDAQLPKPLPTTIPTNYLMGDVEQRTELLSGLLHGKSRRYNKREDIFQISTRNREVLGQYGWLIESLAHRTRPMQNDKTGTYTILFKSRIKLVDDQEPAPVKVHHARRYIKRVEKIAPQMCYHVETDGKDGSYLVGEGFIACH